MSFNKININLGFSYDFSKKREREKTTWQFIFFHTACQVEVTYNDTNETCKSDQSYMGITV